MIGSEGRRHRQHRQFAEEDHAIGHRSLQHFCEDDISPYMYMYIYMYIYDNNNDGSDTTGLRRKAEGGVGG